MASSTSSCPPAALNPGARAVDQPTRTWRAGTRCDPGLHFFTARAALPHMASGGAIVASRPSPRHRLTGVAGYAAAKGGTQRAGPRARARASAGRHPRQRRGTRAHRRRADSTTPARAIRWRRTGTPTRSPPSWTSSPRPTRLSSPARAARRRRPVRRTDRRLGPARPACPYRPRLTEPLPGNPEESRETSNRDRRHERPRRRLRRAACEQKGSRSYASTAPTAPTTSSTSPTTAGRAGRARRLGPVDILVNSAGVVGPNAPLWEVSTADWDAPSLST